MCEICRQTPCHSQCPHAIEPVHETCVIRGCAIYDGMEYYQSNSGPVCRYCMDDMTAKEIIELTGNRIEVA